MNLRPRLPRPRAQAARTACWALLATTVALVAGATQAAAAGQDPDGSTGNPLLDSFPLSDTDGQRIGDYTLSIDDGGWSGRATGQSISAWLLTTGWEAYRGWVAVSLWIYQLARQLVWLDLLRGPVEDFAGVLQDVVDELGIVPVFAVIAAIAAGLWAKAGRYGTAVGQFAIALVLSTLAVSVLTNPVATLAGEDGAVASAQELGVEMGDRISAGPAVYGPPAPGEELDESANLGVSGQLLDILVRTPHQIINYGSVIDAGCVQAYDESLGAEDARESVGDCGESYAEAAENPSAGLNTLAFVFPAASFLVLVMVALAGVLLVGTLAVLWQGAMLVFHLVKGILPVGGRVEIWQCLLEILSWLLVIVGALLGIGLYVRILQALLSSDDWSPLQSFVVVDIFLLLGAAALVSMAIKARKRGRQWGKDLASKTSPKPVVPPTPSPVATMASQAVSHGAALAGSNAVGALRDNSASGGGRLLATRPAGTASTPRPSLGSRTVGAVRTTGKTAALVGKVAFGSTLGAPVYAPRAAMQVAGAATTAAGAVRTKLSASRERAAAGVGAQVASARAFGQEYSHNVAVAGRTLGKVTGANAAGRAASRATLAPRVASQLRRPVPAAPATEAGDQARRNRTAAHAGAGTGGPAPRAPRPSTADSAAAIPTLRDWDGIIYDKAAPSAPAASATPTPGARRGRSLRERAQALLGSRAGSPAVTGPSARSDAPVSSPPRPGPAAATPAPIPAADRVAQLRARLQAAREHR